MGQVASRAQSEDLSNGRLTVATDHNRSVSCPDCKPDSPRHSPQFRGFLVGEAGRRCHMRTHTHSRHERPHPPAPRIARSIDTDDDAPAPQRGSRKPILSPKLEGPQLPPGLPARRLPVLGRHPHQCCEAAQHFQGEALGRLFDPPHRPTPAQPAVGARRERATQSPRTHMPIQQTQEALEVPVVACANRQPQPSRSQLEQCLFMAPDLPSLQVELLPQE